MLLIDKTRLFGHLIEQHASEASLLWSQRALAVNQVTQTPVFIRKLELRMVKHLRGLLLAPDHAWDIARAAMDDGGSGELFVLAVLAFHLCDDDKINQVLVLGERHSFAFSGLVSACAWLPDEKIHSLLRGWMESRDLWLRYVATCVCSLRRLDPIHHLTDILTNGDTSTRLYARALRLAGELKRRDLLSIINERGKSDDEDICFWINTTRLLLGDSAAIKDIEPFVLQSGEYQIRAIQLAMRCQNTLSRSWINNLAAAPEQQSQMILALAALGDPGGAEWLLSRMTEPALAPLAGYAFAILTGVDLTDDAWILPYDVDRDDDFVTAAPDGYSQLKYPNIDTFKQYWSRNKNRYINGQRYFMGQPLSSSSNVEHWLREGLQGQRQAAALELALAHHQRVYPNVKQPSVTLYE